MILLTSRKLILYGILTVSSDEFSKTFCSNISHLYELSQDTLMYNTEKNQLNKSSTFCSLLPKI